MKSSIISLVELPSLILSQIYLKFFQEKNSLIVILLHGLFCNEEERNLNHIDPSLGMTTDNFRQFVEYFQIGLTIEFNEKGKE